MPRRPLVLTGGPAVGKTTTGRRLAGARTAGAFVDVDDVRQLVVAGAAAAWEPDGPRQAALAARNACALVRNLTDAGFDVVVADVLAPATVPVYRQLLSGVLVVHLRVPFAEARRRATTRPAWLTEEEFAWLHRRDAEDPPAADVRLDVAGLDPAAQAAAVGELW
ncbi:AAA family ATPase [Kineococcus rhizosphaerae]|uniref:Shikimate kinase n=1 Tax=Kineococcus rhizosphaerae TaxID=559628 RepID=A0A2T0QYN4_9ACTN|nr:hypothetical protein [Kineococcus rhizosphaerae]PRY11481.1 shikimate kinase [Kineococcus rhizosphaerae]